MNPLQEHAHLFANGKFHVMWPDGTSISIDGNILMEFEDWENEYHPNLEPKLIARPISDMSDEETYSLPIIERIFNGVTEANSPSQIQYYLINKANSETLLFEDAKALLGLGVLPFPQTLFDDGTVIDSREV